MEIQSLKVWYLVKWGLIKGGNSCLAYSEVLSWLYLWQEQDYICKRWHWDGHGDGCFQISKHFALRDIYNSSSATALAGVDLVQFIVFSTAKYQYAFFSAKW
jgi:hypothetical protein